MTETNNKVGIYSELDIARLRQMSDTAAFAKSANTKLLRLLNHSLNTGETHPPGTISPDVVTMRSVVVVTDLTDDTQETIALHYPEEADLLEGKISILTPTGLALLGSRVGETVTYEAPGGTRRLRVDEMVYQPEANGNLKE